MRLFVAVRPSADAVEHLRSVAAELAAVRSGRGVVGPELWHVTLAFLGEVPDDRYESVLAAVAAGAAAGSTGSLSLAGGGEFGRSVLWVGLAGDVDALRDTAAAVDGSLRRAGLAGEHRPYRPHLTLGHPRGRITDAELDADVARLAGYAGPSWPLADVELVRSVKGPPVRYETLTGWPLGGTTYQA